MIPLKSILAATDFSASATNAVHQAALLAKQQDARLSIVHVVADAGARAPAPDLDPTVNDGLDKLRRLALDMGRRYDVVTTAELRTGATVDELQRAAASADLLVIGQRQRNRFAHWVSGGLAPGLAERCAVPVLVVKQAAQSRYRRVLVPVDLSPAADPALIAAASLAPEVGMHVFHAFEAEGGEALLRQAGVDASLIRERRTDEETALAARLRRGMARRGLDTGDMRFGFDRGLPTRATLRQAHAVSADLIAATTPRGAARLLRSGLGSVDRLLAGSPCDVLLVPDCERATPRRRRPALTSGRRPTPAAASGNWLPASAATARTPSWTRPQACARAALGNQRGALS